nr:MAG TPA: hypothetical protein [Caudoviricetes sp.]
MKYFSKSLRQSACRQSLTSAEYFFSPLILYYLPPYKNHSSLDIFL